MRRDMVSISLLVPALIFGVAFGNLLKGVPFYFDNDMRIFYTGSFWALLNPFSLATGLVSLSMLIMHGAVYLQLNSTLSDSFTRHLRPSGV